MTVSAGTGGITIGYIKTQGGYASYGSGRGGMAGSVTVSAPGTRLAIDGIDAYGGDSSSGGGAGALAGW